VLSGSPGERGFEPIQRVSQAMIRCAGAPDNDNLRHPLIIGESECAAVFRPSAPPESLRRRDRKETEKRHGSAGAHCGRTRKRRDAGCARMACPAVW
jgi:hypothetical protein